MEFTENGNFLQDFGINQSGNGEETALLKVILILWEESQRKLIKCLSEDILAEAKLDVLEVFSWVSIEESSMTEKEKIKEMVIVVEEMTEKKMMIETRHFRYPSDKITFTIPGITKNKLIRFFNIGLNLNGKFGVDVILEDSQRNFLSSFI